MSAQAKAMINDSYFTSIERPAGYYPARLLKERAMRKNAKDIMIGANLRLRRQFLGLSQKSVGLGLGVTFQQVQKYESGTNRLSPTRLLQLGVLLDVPVGYFLDAHQK